MKTADIEVTLLDSMGDDLTVVNAARVSFDKTSDYVLGIFEDGYEGFGLSPKDAKLIRYLAQHHHWTPFGHVTLSFRIKAPIFVARQLAKHQVGLVWNEVSRRYVDSELEFYVPKVWRLKADDKKQGSQESGWNHKDLEDLMDDYDDKHPWRGIDVVLGWALSLYEDMIDVGVCPEQARMVLPLNSMTTWWWTGSLAAFARVCRLRLDPHAQEETRQVAKLISEQAAMVTPISWKELMNGYC